MKFLLYFVMLFLLLNGFATAKSLIQDSCKKAARIPDIKYDLCVKSLEANPQGKAAKSLEELLVVSVQNAASKARSVKGTIEKMLKEKRFEKESEMPLRDCLRLYTEAIDFLNEAMASAKSRSYKTSTTDVEAARGAPTTCELAFKESKKRSPLKKENEALYELLWIPYMFTSMLIP